MSNIFFISDTHFGHANLLKFTRADGVTPLRPWDDIHEHDEALIDNWNKTVTKHDTVYHLGDVAMTAQALQLLKRCKGNKILIRGNHDKYKLKFYVGIFSDIQGCKMFHPNKTRFKAGLTHIPIHPSSVPKNGFNIHGHLHYREVLTEAGEVDPRYINVSVERINYTPISLDDILRFHYGVYS